jgi:transcriptional regulator with XRE-family HTH domain
MPDSSDGPTVLRILLGTHLRRLREAKGISARQAAAAIRASDSKISRIELGRNAIREIDVLDLLTLYGVDVAEREELLTLAEQSNRPAWWHRYNDILPEWFAAYVGMEEAARSIRVYEAQFIPGLLQTEEYASAVLALGDFPMEESERHVVLRTERQRRFREGKLRLWAIVDEAAIRHPVAPGAGVAVHLEQLRYLRDLSGTPTLTLQVLPYGMGGHASPTGFSILRFTEQDLPDVVYVENLTSALYLDKQADVDRYLLAMERLSILARDPQRTREILDDIIKELEAARDGLRPRRSVRRRADRRRRPVGEEHVQRPHRGQLRGSRAPHRRPRGRQGLAPPRRPGAGVPGGRVGRLHRGRAGRRLRLTVRRAAGRTHRS